MAYALSSAGYNTIYIPHIKEGMSDDEVKELGRKTDAIIVSEDKDFYGYKKFVRVRQRWPLYRMMQELKSSGLGDIPLSSPIEQYKQDYCSECEYKECNTSDMLLCTSLRVFNLKDYQMSLYGMRPQKARGKKKLKKF